MANNPKPTTISDDPEIATDHRVTRLRRIVALTNFILLPILGALFLALVSKREIQPIYGWIADTALATVGDRLANVFGQQAFRLSADLAADRRLEAEALLQRMSARTPTHAALTRNGTAVFGKLLDRTDRRIEIGAVDGRLNETRFIPTADLRLIKPLVHPEVELSARDANFLLAHEGLRHFCLSPLLVVTDEGYAAAHDAFLSLTLLEEAFLNEFATIVDADAGRNRLLHLVLTSVPMPTAARDSHHAANADAWYDPDNDVLAVVYSNDLDRRTSYLRHEGAHELCRRYNLFGQYATSPLWLREGIAQYCETSPFGGAAPAHRKTLAKQQIPWEALVQPRSLATIGDELDAATFYAQSWYLASWLMTDKHRSRFLRFLATNRDTPENLTQLIPLLNALNTTTATLEDDFHAFLKQSPEGTPAPL